MPHASIKGVHDIPPPGNDPHGHVGPGHFSVGGEVGGDVKVALSAGRVRSESGDDFIENEQCLGFFRDSAERVKELTRLEFGSAALHGFHQNSGQLGAQVFDGFQGSVFTVGEDNDVLDGPFRNPRGRRKSEGMSGVHIAPDDHFVEVSVVASTEDDDFLPPCESACAPNSSLHRFGARADKAGSVEAGQFADELCCFTGQRRLRTDLDPAVQLSSERIEYTWVCVAEKVGPKSIQEIDIDIAVDITKASAFGVLDDNRVDHLFPCSVEE